ncbi:nudix hydrolase 16, mitochondrial-like isoform X1 [Salvia splendens]|uniref:nudix hydrolase 16, mitochondrial-like isoform X1 n=1 Tax=Salvia splendens TaxID=180675 RepID=UPI001C271484|nr:nudix hydrolase 16, mitochondrial-like isoform X1 [Salvia splendens]XP_042066835.1 nudix hydrolase 16, mitochondrial-like isoform X1 [Salvia splendens]
MRQPILISLISLICQCDHSRIPIGSHFRILSWGIFSYILSMFGFSFIHLSEVSLSSFLYQNSRFQANDFRVALLSITYNKASLGSVTPLFDTNLSVEGGWENDETAEEAAEREAMEEAGVRGDLVHFLGCYPFKSKTLQDEYSPQGLCRAATYALHVKEELDSWPEKSHRQRSWLTVGEAIGCCRHAWMRDALEKGFSKWYDDGMIHTLPRKGSR